MPDLTSRPSSRSPEFPIVGIGASAGGLDAVNAFLQGLPPDPEMAFVLVMHLSPDRESHLEDLLPSATSMPVTTVAKETDLEPAHLYVLAPRTELRIEEGLRLIPEARAERDGAYHPIDRLFRSLAEEAGSRSVGVVLSGSGTDGSQGVREINQQNGFVLVQDPAEAAFSSMPGAAIRAVPPDLIGSARELGRQLAETLEAPRAAELPERSEDLLGQDVDRYHRLLARLKSHAGHDFGSYKSPTLLRRIGRRVQIKGLSSLDDYLGYVREHPEELTTLYQDLLIPVTSFFRDREVFEYVLETVIPKLFEGREASDSVRIWVPACSTGEEAYSYALLFNEYAARRPNAPDVQLFATDVNERSIETAREGTYPETIAEDVDARLLNRYFASEEHSYVVKPEIRDQIVFAEHDLLSDPPFARIDLVSCRNLLIYLRPEQQGRVLKTLHFALRSSGWLVLGSAESAEVGSELFRAENRELSVYRRRETTGVRTDLASWLDGGDRSRSVERALPETRSQGFDAGALHQRVRADQLDAASALVDEDYHVLHMDGGLDRYLRFPDGSFPETILEAAEGHVQTAIRTALYTSGRDGTEAVRQRVPIDDGQNRVTIRVRPIDWEEERLFLVVVEPVSGRKEGSEVEERERGPEATIQELEQELEETREQLQATTEQYETTNEELRASNEELLSMNEELQSTTEELETSKEELESMNEEMQTVNDELKQKVEELNEAYADLENLMAATQIPTLFLDEDLTIRRFTPSATEVFNIQDTDRGRSIGDLTTKIEYDGLAADARRAREEKELIEREVRSNDDRWYLMRVRPYWMDDEVRGTVTAFIDITDRQEARMRLEALNEELEERVRERTAELEEEVEERERLQREILRMADEERFRLGERLHDGLGQELAGIRMMLRAHAEVLEERGLEELAEKAATIQEAVNDADRHTRGLAEEIVPVELEQGDLRDALTKLAQDIEELHDIRLDLEFGDGVDFEGSSATQVFRIVQEAVLNAVRHGNSESVAVRIVPDEDVLLVEVTDDGVGPSGDLASMKSEGMGLRIMQYRAGLLGGTLKLEEAEGGGTRVRVRIPETGA